MEFIIRGGKPVAVILGIKDYLHLLEQIEDSEDIQEVARLKKKKLRFRSFDDYLAKRKS